MLSSSRSSVCLRRQRDLCVLRRSLVVSWRYADGLSSRWWWSWCVSTVLGLHFDVLCFGSFSMLVGFVAMFD